MIGGLQISVFEQGKCKRILLSQRQRVYVGRCRQLCGRSVQMKNAHIVGNQTFSHTRMQPPMSVCGSEWMGHAHEPSALH